MSWKPDIFDYVDYRQYLADYYTAAKENNRSFSYRYFSRKAGFSSPNFLKLVIDGKRNLGGDSIDKFAKGLDLVSVERRFFADLVAFGQAESDEERNEAYERIAGSKRFQDAKKMDHSYFQYLSVWYYPAIREMVARVDFQEDPEWIAAQLLPPIKPKAAEEALELLLELGLLVREASGELSRGNPTIATGHREFFSLAAGNYHRQMLTRAAQSIELVDRENRHLTSMTVCVSRDTIDELIDRMQTFTETSLDLCDNDGEPTMVYQFSMQLFPLSTPEGEADISNREDE